MRYKLIFILISAFVLIGLIQTIFQTTTTEGTYVELSQGKIGYDVYGEGEKTIIMIHGSPGGKDDFEKLAPEIKNYKVYTIDMYGFGNSEKRVKNYGISSQAEVLNEFIEKLEIKNPVILGYSWGGGVATEYAHKYPEKTRALVLLAGMGIQEGEATGNYYGEHLRYIAAYPFIMFYPISFLRTLTSFTGEAGFIESQQKINGFMRSFMDSDQRVTRNHMQQITTPTLILHGNSDTVIETWVAEEHFNLLPNAKLVYFDGGHGTVFRDVSQIAPYLNSFLEDLDNE